MGRYSSEGLELIRIGNERRFIADAKRKFGGKFDYSQVKYVRQKVPVKIICPTHGSFSQTPDKHLQATFGCPRCGVDSRASKKKDASKTRFFKYVHEHFPASIKLIGDYVSVKDPISFRCLVHNLVVETTPDQLKALKHACPRCAAESGGLLNRKSHADFLADAKQKFGGRFDYSLVDYKTTFTPVSIICRIHGRFIAKPTNFMNSDYGCTKCGRLNSGYSADRITKLEAGVVRPRPTRLAVMRVEVFGISAIKVGVTHRSLEARYGVNLKEVIYETKMPELDALKLEQHVHGTFSAVRDNRILGAGIRSGKRWSGDTEIYFEKSLQELIEFIDSAVQKITKNAPDYWESTQLLMPPVHLVRKVDKRPGKCNPPKPVKCLETGQVFSSATAAAKAIGSTQALVSMVCNGKRGETKGLRFAYVMDLKTGQAPVFVNHNRGGNHKWARRVRCIETGVVYATITEAAGATGAQGSKITTVCRGKRRSAGGLAWEYVDD